MLHFNFSTILFSVPLHIYLYIYMSYGTHPPAFSVNTELHVFYCCWSVAKSCPTFYDSMGCSTPGSLSSTISQSFLKFTSFKSVMLSNHLILCRPLFLLLSIFPASGFFFFPVSWLFTSSGQGIGASASASVLPVNIQG